jgi:spermidine/putrescine transport system permease protein
MKSIRFSRKQLAIPYSVFLVLFVLIPIIIIIYYAFSDSTGAMSWSALVNFFTSRTKVDVLFRSLLIGLLNTIICLIIGYPLAYFLANKKFNKNYVLVLLFIMPMWINFVLRIGALKDLLTWMNLKPKDYPYLDTIIGLCYDYLPFTILPLYSTMLKLDNSQIEAAMDLGANRRQTFIKAILPQTVPGIVAASQMVFMPTLSSYVVSDVLSQRQIVLFGNSIYASYTNGKPEGLNEASFMALIMLVIVFITMLLTHKFERTSQDERTSLW